MNQLNQERHVENCDDPTSSTRSEAWGGSENLKEIVRKEEMGIKLLPNVSEFKIRLGNTDELFGYIGVQRKEPPKIELEP